jgi:hypothetical protein
LKKWTKTPHHATPPHQQIQDDHLLVVETVSRGTEIKTKIRLVRAAVVKCLDPEM